MIQKYFIQLAYKGTAYHGWQYQENALSVQQVLQEKFSLLLREKIEITGAGRTDSGVHAQYFVSHFETNKNFDINQFVQKLNKILPKDIVIFDIFPVKPDVHSRFSALSRTYEYHIHFYKNPFIDEFSWYLYWQPNIKKMNQACQVLFEYTDFTSFSKLHTDVKTNLCRIFFAEWLQNGKRLIFKIKADRFLRNMVRAIVGTMLDLGKETVSIDDFRRIIESKNRCKAGFSVPAHGLHLVDIEYKEDIRL